MNLARFKYVVSLVISLLLASSASAYGEDSKVLRQSTEHTLLGSVTELRADDILSEREKLNLLWKLEFSGRRIDDNLTEADRVRMRLVTNANYMFSSQLLLNVQAKLDLISESSRSIFEDKSESTSGLVLQEAAMIFLPTSAALIKLGAINQEFLDAPLLLADKSFPAVLEQIQWQSRLKATKFQLVAQQAIPTSHDLGTRTTDAEPTPYLLTSTLAAEQTIWSNTKLAAHATYFHFSVLPSQVAQASQAYGNSIDILTATGDEFRYRFAGVEAGISYKGELNDYLAAKVQYSYLENFRAPEDINKGQIASLSIKVLSLPKVYLEPKISYFINQSDSAPGYYNSYIIGHNNRFGYAYELDAFWTSINLHTGVRYVESQLINKKPFANDQDFFMVYVSTEYAEL